MDNSYIAGKILVWLELLIFCFFSLSNDFKENRICTCRWVTVACKDLREWGWRRYGCVGSDWMLCAFGGVTCTVDWELMHGGDLHSFSNPCWRHWLLSHADSSKTGSKKMRFGYFFSPASFSELLLTSFIVMRSAFRIEYFSVPLSLRWKRSVHWLFLQHSIISASIPAQDGWLNKALNKPDVDWCIRAMRYCHHQWLSAMA